MSVYIDRDEGFRAPDGASAARECPHCGAYAQLTLVAAPEFDRLKAQRPVHVGAAFQCAACHEPRFIKFSVRRYGDQRIELAPAFVEVERPRERFDFQYLSGATASLFREALLCYSADCYNAFASMCRRTAQSACAELGEGTRLKWFELIKEVAALCDLDDNTTQNMEDILLGPDERLPEIGAAQAAVLLETLKDILYQSYVRTAKLKAAMRMRRFFAAEQDSKITPLDPHNQRRTGSD